MKLQLSQLDAIESSVEELTAPLQFFVLVQTYHIMTGTPPKEDQIHWKRRHGEPIAGVTWIV